MFDKNLYFNSTAISRLVEREWSAAYARLDLTPSQALALRALIASPGFTPSKLAKTLVVGRPTATRVVDGLCKKRLVERRYSRTDARECQLFPTNDALAIENALEQADSIATKIISTKLGTALAQSASGCMDHMRAILSADDVTRDS
jgi:MarR family transcriptional regulator, organic hydroperoxide resistance regulator